MAVDKLVDSTQLDADLTSVANAIRTKGGTSADLAFPSGFVSAVEAIPTGGGGWTAQGIADTSEPNGPISISGTSIKSYAFYVCDGITDVSGPNVTSIGNYAFAYANGLEVVRFDSWQGTTSTNNYIFGYAGSMSKTIIVLPSIVNFGSRMFSRGMFKTIDIGPNATGSFNADTFYNNTGKQSVGTLIIRRSSGVIAATTTDSINGLRDVYIPKALYDHLGDGGSLDYQSASNWSTQYANGKLTFHQIEGSQYDGYWADGTAISS